MVQFSGVIKAGMKVWPFEFWCGGLKLQVVTSLYEIFVISRGHPPQSDM